MEKGERLYIEEYKTLRAEILQNQRLRMWALAVVFTAVGVILGMPINAPQEVIGSGKLTLDAIINIVSILLPSVALYVVLLTGFVIIYMLSRNITFIGRYIQCRFELGAQNTEQAQWLTKVVRYKDYEQELARHHHSPKASIAYWHADMGLCVVAFLYSVTRWLIVLKRLGGLACFIVVLIYAPVVLYSAYLTYRLKKIGKEKSDFVKFWINVLSEEEGD